LVLHNVQIITQPATLWHIVDAAERTSVRIEDDAEFLTISDVQRILKVGRSFAYGLVERGELPGYRVGGKILRVRRADLERWLEENRCTSSR
jgi:excisionase family DNA binding protein